LRGLIKDTLLQIADLAIWRRDGDEDLIRNPQITKYYHLTTANQYFNRKRFDSQNRQKPVSSWLWQRNTI